MSVLKFHIPTLCTIDNNATKVLSGKKMKLMTERYLIKNMISKNIMTRLKFIKFSFYAWSNKYL